MRNKHYYDDSDDMIERIRKAKEAFEKKTRAFQGADWPHYTKRVIKGQLQKEPPVVHEREIFVATKTPEPNPKSARRSGTATDSTSEPTTANQASSWWATRREARETKPEGEEPHPPADETTGDHRKTKQRQ